MGKNIIITGCSGTIGKAIATDLANSKNAIIALGRKDPHIGKNIDWVQCDISDLSLLYYTFENVIYPKYSKIDAVINVAGIQGAIGKFWDIAWEDFYKCIDINLKASIEVARLSIPLMPPHSKIINFSGGGATSNRPLFSAYAISKIGIVKFTEIAASELLEKKIDINCIAPGQIYSKMTDEILTIGKKHAGEDEYNKALSTKENKNDNSLENVIKLVNFLLSKESNEITGKLISAKWDNWENFASHLNEIKNTDIFKLRRMRGKDLGMPWADK